MDNQEEEKVDFDNQREQPPSDKKGLLSPASQGPIVIGQHQMGANEETMNATDGGQHDTMFSPQHTTVQNGTMMTKNFVFPQKMPDEANNPNLQNQNKQFLKRKIGVDGSSNESNKLLDQKNGE